MVVLVGLLLLRVLEYPTRGHALCCRRVVRDCSVVIVGIMGLMLVVRHDESEDMAKMRDRKERTARRRATRYGRGTEGVSRFAAGQFRGIVSETTRLATAALTAINLDRILRRLPIPLRSAKSFGQRGGTRARLNCRMSAAISSACAQGPPQPPTCWSSCFVLRLSTPAKREKDGKTSTAYMSRYRSAAHCLGEVP